jgi:glycosyltransferase involved in cell wall biosynthesis
MSSSESASAAVTIAVPFFDCARTLGESLQSVFAQTRRDWELLLVDDGSTDGSLEIAAAVDDPRVRIVSDGVNRGLVYRLNQIADLATTPYLCRMDGDDVMHPRRLELQLAYLEAHPEVDVVGSPIVSIDETGTIRGARGTRDIVGGPAALLRGVPFVHPTALGRTRWFRAHRYDARFVRAEDHELWCRTAGDARLAMVPEPLLFYREPARPNLRGYVLSCRTDRAIFRRYGPAVVGQARTAAVVAKSLAKETCYRAACAVGLGGALVAMRSGALRSGVRQAANAALEVVRQTAVPGLGASVAPLRRARG